MAEGGNGGSRRPGTRTLARNLFNQIGNWEIQGPSRDVNRQLQVHPSFIQKLSVERILKDQFNSRERLQRSHNGEINSLSWNAEWTLLVSGSDDQTVKIWDLHNGGDPLAIVFESGHKFVQSSKFMPESSNKWVATSGSEGVVRVFDFSEGGEPGHMSFHCHAASVKKLAVEHGNPHLLWSASEDGTVKQHDIRESCLCRRSEQPCHNVLVDLRLGHKRSISDPPCGILGLVSCDISLTRPYQLLVGGRDAFGRLYDRRMLTLHSITQRPPECVNMFCPDHLSQGGYLNDVGHVTFSLSGQELLLSYAHENIYLFDINNIDMSQTYTGHLNSRFFIVEASFWGANGQYVASGSNRKAWYIWEKKTGNLVKVLHHEHPNLSCIKCVQPHPSDCLIATTGDTVFKNNHLIKIWSPCSQDS